MPLGKLAALSVLALLSCERTAYQSQPDGTCEPPQVILKRPGDNLPPNPTYQNNGTPPVRYRGDRSVMVEFVAPDKVEQACGLAKPVCGYRMMACRRGNRLIMPNPCAGNHIVEPYGKLLCHELGHANGWPAYHGD